MYFTIIFADKSSQKLKLPLKMDEETNLKHRKNNKVSKPIESPNISELDEPNIIEKDYEGLVPDFRSQFWLTRVIFVRCLALTYYVAFIMALQQNKPLIGDGGLTPMKLTFEKVQQKGE